MKTKVSFKSNTRKLSGIVKSVPRNKILVGWIDTPNHWRDPNLPVSTLAAILYYESSWGKDGFSSNFMLDRSNSNQVKQILYKNLQALGETPFRALCKKVGRDLEERLIRNIFETDTPPNDPSWILESGKGISAPLRHGSLTGQSPNLVSEVSSKVTKA